VHPRGAARETRVFSKITWKGDLVGITWKGDYRYGTPPLQCACPATKGFPQGTAEVRMLHWQNRFALALVAVASVLAVFNGMFDGFYW